MKTSPEHFDVAIVGAGIVGLGLAWAAQRMGLQTLLLERSSVAQGASIRNFGMLWPIGQPAGDRRQLAMRNRDLWLELADQSGIWLEECGSLHLAHHEDEWRVLQEFIELPAESEYSLDLLSPKDTRLKTGLAQPAGLIGSLYSPHECRVAPRQAIAAIATYLASVGVRIHFGTSVMNVEEGKLTSSQGDSWQAERVYVCSGADFANLYPQQHAAAQLRICKLHMLRTPPLSSGRTIGPHLASGLTLRHYESFRACPSLADVQQRVATTTPELDRLGIHVLVSQDADGRLVLGDSHEYDADIDPFEKSIIDDLIIRELRKVYELPTWDIDARWTGVYAKYHHGPWLQSCPEPNVTILNGFGGAGMSLSLAVAERVIHEQFTSRVGASQEAVSRPSVQAGES